VAGGLLGGKDHRFLRHRGQLTGEIRHEPHVYHAPASGHRPARELPAPLRPAAAARAGQPDRAGRRWAGAALAVGTAAGLLLSASVGLFGYTESLAVPSAQTSLVVEFTGAAVLAAAAAIVLAAPLPRRRS